MVERGDRACFAIEAFGELILRGLNRDKTPQPGITSFPDFAHSAGADPFESFVGTEALSSRKARHDRMNYIREGAFPLLSHHSLGALQQFIEISLHSAIAVFHQRAG